MSVSYVLNGGLLTVLNSDRNYYVPGEPVRIRLFKINISSRPITLTYPTAQRYDFSVSGPAGEVWRWSRGKTFAQVTTRITLRPGQSRSYTEIWPQVTDFGRPVGPGFYRITGWNTFMGFARFAAPSIFINIG